MFKFIPAAISAFALLFLVYVAGLASAYLGLKPYLIATSTWRTVKALTEEPGRLMPAHYDFEGVRIHDADAVAPGSTFITAYFPELDWRAGARLIDVDGTILHTWNIDVAGTFGAQYRRPYIHGAYLYPNGDIIASFEFVGLARVSACGETIWSFTDPDSHHSVARADDGTFWVSGNRELTGPEGRNESLVKILGFPVYEDLLVNVGPDGEVLKVVSTLRVLDRNGLAEKYLRIGEEFRNDIFHMNDVEPLSSDMAADYPLFEAGDLLVSLRDVHMVLVVDPDTLDVKWHTVSDTLYQHDPDFIGDGWIGVFDNRFDRTEDGSLLGGSRIVAIRPHTGERKVLFPKDPGQDFYTKWSGKWQKLENGNLLLTEARRGHALEVTEEGDPVWEWVIERFNDTEITEVMEATRYPITADDVAAWDCE